MLRRKVSRALISLAAMVFLSSCSSLDGNPAGNVLGPVASFPQTQFDVTEGNNWTVLIYIAADNSTDGNVEPLVSTLEQISYSYDGVRVRAMVDRLSQEGTTTYDISADADMVVTVSAEKNTADPAVLEEFIESGMALDPTAKVMLVMKGSGYGWRGLCPDESSGGEVIGIDNLAGVLKGKGVDLLVCDASYMGLLEIAFELRESVPYMVSTQSTITDAGMPYDLLIDAVLTYPEISARDMAVELVDRYADLYYEDFGTISAFDLAKMCSVGDAFCAVTEILKTKMTFFRTIIAPARDHSEIGLNNAVDQSEYVHDVWVFFTDLEAIPDNVLRLAIGDLKAAFEEAVIAEGHSFRYRDVPHGLSFWFPPSLTKSSCDAVTYDGRFIYSESDLDLIEASAWLECLNNYFVVARLSGYRHHLWSH